METAPATRGAKTPRHQAPAATDVEREQLWGAETMKAVENFPVSGQPIPAPVVRWLGRIKATAARVNAELGLLDADIAERVAAAGDAIAEGEHDDQFPVDVFQTGSGTSSPARVEMTSSTLVLVEVPDPVWKTSIGNWSSNSPAAILSPAAAIRSAFSGSRSPSSAFTRAAAALMRPSQRATDAGIGSPETGKFSTAFIVSPPQRSFGAASFTLEA